jgi:hypothetical protein
LCPEADQSSLLSFLLVDYWATLGAAGWSWGCVATVDSNGRTIFVVDAHRDDGKRFAVRADEKLTAFVELESAIRAAANCLDCWRNFRQTQHR